jgi:protein-S-isoprenylcysteine O-methyltransferase Ste14
MYARIVLESPALVFVGAVFALKLLIEIWGQQTPTWAAPGTFAMLFLVYGLGIPSFVLFYAYCREVDVHVPYREPLGIFLNLFGSAYSLSYEIHRFWWKAQPENKGRLHTTGLARYCIHPNYFGDFFTYTGWGLVAGTQCAMSVAPAAFFWLTLFVVPNSDAYLAQRYPDEFPAYLAKTARLIPGVRSPLLATVLAWIGLFVSMAMEMNCSSACGLA